MYDQVPVAACTGTSCLLCGRPNWSRLHGVHIVANRSELPRFFTSYTI